MKEHSVKYTLEVCTEEIPKFLSDKKIVTVVNRVDAPPNIEMVIADIQKLSDDKELTQW